MKTADKMRRNQQVDKSLATNGCMDDYIENILAENLTLKRKLGSKCEAILILNEEVNRLKHGKEQMKAIIDDLKVRQLSTNSEPDVPPTDSNRSLRLEVESLRQKLRDALGDVQALRCRFTPKTSSQHIGEEACDMIREEKLVDQLEALLKSKMQLEADFQAILDEKEELVTERDAYKCKLHRLNHECNVLLSGNTDGIIDLDALIMENRFLQERLLQAQEECQLAKQVSERYKSMLQAKKHKGVVNGTNRESNQGMLLSQKQVKELLESCGTTEVPGSDASLTELRSLCLALLDSLGDKTLALSHQKRANRMLAARIAELQGRLAQLHAKKAVESPSTVLLEGYKSLVEPITADVSEGAKDIDHSSRGVSLEEGVCNETHS